VTEKCICDGWEWESFESWSTCPNCDFPADRLVWVKNLMSTADRRLELLRDWNSRRVNEQEACLFCGEYPMTTERIEKGKREFVFWDKHSGDCELAKELSDA
jgi:hypothetical protein